MKPTATGKPSTRAKKTPSNLRAPDPRTKSKRFLGHPRASDSLGSTQEPAKPAIPGQKRPKPTKSATSDATTFEALTLKITGGDYALARTLQPDWDWIARAMQEHTKDIHLECQNLCATAAKTYRGTCDTPQAGAERDAIRRALDALVERLLDNPKQTITAMKTEAETRKFTDAIYHESITGDGDILGDARADALLLYASLGAKNLHVFIGKCARRWEAFCNKNSAFIRSEIVGTLADIEPDNPAQTTIVWERTGKPLGLSFEAVKKLVKRLGKPAPAKPGRRRPRQK